MTDVGPFRLVNPPEGQAEIIKAAVEAIDFPWERFDKALTKDTDRAILVEWGDTGQNVSGTANGYGLYLTLSTTNYHLGAAAGFVFAHEVGHLVDSATLRDEDRRAIMGLTHISPKTHRYDGVEQNGMEHGWSHNQKHDDSDWENYSDDYLFRHNEAFADLFVEAFAPTIWDGTFYPGAPVKGPDWLRFVHTTDSLDMLRELVLWDPDPVVPEEDSLSRGKPIDRLIEDMTRWLNSHPKRTKKHLKVRAARKILRSIPKR